ncbi:MAG TPA: pilus assembly protein PilM [Vicinamibacterales bacterium]|nr:pilus assembly protein PilM [Vicinamibacterales bacterium]
MSPSLFSSPAPCVAIEIGPAAVSGLTLARHGAESVIAAYATEPLPPGVVTPSLTGANVADGGALAGAVAQVLGRLGGRPRWVSLVVPDTMAKVSLVRLEKVPARADDLDQLIRWHVRKTAPFRLEEAQLTWSAGAAAGDGSREYVVALARQAVVREYEAACEAAGATAGVVDLATFSLVNAVLAAGEPDGGDWLLVHVTPRYGSLAILRGRDLIFFRNRSEGTDETLADLVHQTAMYYEDRLGGSGGFSRVLVAASSSGDGGPGGIDALARQVEERLRVRTQMFDPTGIARFADRIGADQAVLRTVTPLLGVLARGR